MITDYGNQKHSSCRTKTVYRLTTIQRAGRMARLPVCDELTPEKALRRLSQKFPAKSKLCNASPTQLKLSKLQSADDWPADGGPDGRYATLEAGSQVAHTHRRGRDLTSIVGRISASLGVHNSRLASWRWSSRYEHRAHCRQPEVRCCGLG